MNTYPIDLKINEEGTVVTANDNKPFFVDLTKLIYEYNLNVEKQQEIDARRGKEPIFTIDEQWYAKYENNKKIIQGLINNYGLGDQVEVLPDDGKIKAKEKGRN